MPNISLTLPEVTQSVSRPIIFDIISQIQEITKIDKATTIKFAGDTGRMQQPGTNIDGTGLSSSRDPSLTGSRTIYIDVEEDYDEGTLGSTAVSQNEHIPVFLDKDLSVVITPVYATTNVVINFKYKSTSKTEVTRWRDDVRMRISQLRDINLHNITYHYLLPVPYIEALGIIYDLRENVSGYGDRFQDYVTAHSTNRLTLIGDLVNNSARLGISETQTQIVGMYGFDGLPEKPERNDDNGTWTISFSYKFSYEKPIACNMKYPIMIHNQLMPEKYVTLNKSSPDYDNRRLSFSRSMEALRFFELHLQADKHIDLETVIYLPEHDEFTQKTEQPGTGSIFYALCELDPTHPRALLNLKELGPLVIDKDIRDFLVNSEYPYITRLYKSIIQVNLYRNNYLANDRFLTCDSSLNIESVTDLNLRINHRIRFSLVTDLTMLDPEAMERLRKYPKALVKIMSAINDVLRNHPGVTDLGTKRQVSLSDFGTLFKFMTGFDYSRNTPYQGNSNVAKNNYAATSSTPGYGYEGRPSVMEPDMSTRFNDPTKLSYGGLKNPLDPLADLRGSSLEDYRRNKIQRNTLQVTSIIAVQENR